MTSTKPRARETRGYEKTKPSQTFVECAKENGRSIPTPGPRNPRNKLAAIGRTTARKTESDAIHRITIPSTLMKFT
jgi:hypothetical protein